jgi:hypothetical protein
MSHIIPLDALEGQPAKPDAFELWLPNPVMGKALFLLLDLDGGWTFEFNPAETAASRYIVYRERMWVREGKARIIAIRADGSRVEINLTVKQLQPRIRECGWIREEQRHGLFRRWRQVEREEAITSRCCRTERQIRLCWKAKDARRQSQPTAGAEGYRADPVVRTDVELLLSNLHCH